MSDPVFIRAARPDEARHLSEVAMRSKAHWGYSAAFMEACRVELAVTPAKIEDDSYHYFVAERDGAILGFCAIVYPTDTDCELEALFVEPSHIGTGIGRALMDRAKTRAAGLGARRLTIQGDPNARDFYCAAGGEIVGSRESGSIPGRFLPVFAISLERT